MSQNDEPDARAALSEAFARALLASWTDHGAGALEVVLREKPDLYVKLVTAILPKEPTTKAALDELDDAALDRRIASLCGALGLSIRAGPDAGGQGPATGEDPA